MARQKGARGLTGHARMHDHARSPRWKRLFSWLAMFGWVVTGCHRGAHPVAQPFLGTNQARQ
eukprot:921292-Amphidinium_carterae.1